MAEQVRRRGAHGGRSRWADMGRGEGWGYPHSSPPPPPPRRPRPPLRVEYSSPPLLLPAHVFTCRGNPSPPHTHTYTTRDENQPAPHSETQKRYLFSSSLTSYLQPCRTQSGSKLHDPMPSFPPIRSCRNILLHPYASLPPREPSHLPISIIYHAYISGPSHTLGG